MAQRTMLGVRRNLSTGKFGDEDIDASFVAGESAAAGGEFGASVLEGLAGK